MPTPTWLQGFPDPCAPEMNPTFCWLRVCRERKDVEDEPDMWVLGPCRVREGVIAGTIMVDTIQHSTCAAEFARYGEHRKLGNVIIKLPNGIRLETFHYSLLQVPAAER